MRLPELGSDSVHRIQAGGLGCYVAGVTCAATFLVGTIGHLEPWKIMVFGPVGGLLAGAASAAFASYFSSRVGQGAQAVVWPSGTTTPYEHAFSPQDALVARGRIAEALEGFEGIITRFPDNVAAYLKAADLYAGKGKNPERAAALLRAARTRPGATPAQDVYASSRLIDLYLGPLADEGRALVELRKLIERHPDSAAAREARTALARIKAQRRERDAGVDDGPG